MSESTSTSLIFVCCKGAFTNTINQIPKISNVETVNLVTGLFNLAVKLGTNEPTIAFDVLERIRTIKTITTTRTALSFQAVTSTTLEDTEQLLAFALVKVKGGSRMFFERSDRSRTF